MKIKKLEIIGFKSFLEKASIQFPGGISAVVGPNGCGKSNIIDAVRWVMGEQSVKQLRGKSMEDVIFAGASGKPPLNMAEVSLTLLNDNGSAPEELKDFSEINVTRRLYRSGESLYMINKQPCRLKDVHNLFMGSGMGPRTYAVIQQGSIGAITEAGPDERRVFIEEAAGVTRYKLRKNEALRKVKATNQNLLRINDIIVELNRQMAGLKRQAKRAERYKGFQKRARQIDTCLLLHYFDDYNRQIEQDENIIKQLKDTDLSRVAQLKKIDAAVEAVKLEQTRKGEEISRRSALKFETQRQIDRSEAELKHLKSEIERLSNEIREMESTAGDLEAKSEAIVSEIDQVRQQNSQFEENIIAIKNKIEGRRQEHEKLQDQLALMNRELDALKDQMIQLAAEEARYNNIYQTASSNKDSLLRRLKKIDEEVVLAGQKLARLKEAEAEARDRWQSVTEEIKVIKKTITELEQRLGSRSDQLGRQVKKTQELELERNKLKSEQATLSKMAANYEWYKDGVKAIMKGGTKTDPALGGVLGLLAEGLEPEPGFETAVEAVLGEALQYIVVSSHETARQAISFLKNESAGRVGFIPAGALRPIVNSKPAPPPRGALRLLDHVSVQPEHENTARILLGHVYFSETLEEALEIHNRNGRFQTLVTRSGEVITCQGMILGGSTDSLSGILAKKQELKQLQGRIESLENEILMAKDHQHNLEKQVRLLETELQQTIEEKNRLVDDSLELEKRVFRAGEEVKAAQRHLEILELEQEQLMGEESDLDEEITKYNQALAKINEQMTSVRSQSEQTTHQMQVVSDQLEAFNQGVIDLKMQLTSLNAKLENGRNTLARLEDFQSDATERLEQLKREIVQKRAKRQKAEEQILQHREGLQGFYAKLEELERHLESDQAEYANIDQRLKESDQRIASLKSEREKTLEQLRLLELTVAEKRVKRDNIVAKVQERYHCSIAALRNRHAGQAESLDMSVREMEQELARLKAKIANIGDVNLGAIKEYEQLKERFDFLTRQRDDLVKAIDDLHKVIRKINRITQQRFMETFSKVNEKLKEVFPNLFEGGSARLELTEPDNPLETGVEYFVHPQGKKLTRMSLLSGGEKALAAIAFVFAIFLIKPASFCLLDEIDAPLDDANVIRFNNLMRLIGQKSQIIMITHNKKSMEFAETLFGITMEQKGISKVVSVNLQGQN